MTARFSGQAGGLDDVLSRVPGHRKSGSGWLARCPAHDDSGPSLSISETADGRVLLHCFAGCAFDSVRSALGLSRSDLGPPSTRPTDRKMRRQRERETDRAGSSFTAVQAQALWEAALAAAWSDERLREDAEVYAYLARRSLVEAWELRLVGVLTPDLARSHGLTHWYAEGHRVLVPLHGVDGRIVNVQARCIFKHARKTLFPAGSRVKGTHFANSSAIQRLNAEQRDGGPVLYGEGLTDFLALSIVAPHPVLAAPGTPFVAAGVGPWARGADVYLAVDNDRAGDQTLQRAAARCFDEGARRVVRVRWPEGCVDACDALSRLGSVGLAERLRRLITEGPHVQ